ncbi:MAG: 5-formyltetrahydrofolate cyclo-ligase [Proteobacteria bacterium]|nr:5-formyltetrahydrofolate cyclo-ligase [Pseudomonadota bacterium]
MSSSKLKSQLRQHLRRKRNALNTDQVQRHSKIIVEKICNSPLWHQSQQIGIYLPFNNEVDLTALLYTNKSCFIPSIQGTDMQFHRHHERLNLITTSFGLSQPKFISRHQRPDMDLCIMPLVGFDHQGHRLGMGGGYYDRYFENNKNTVLWGVAHAIQEYDELPNDPWDVKLHGIITEQTWLTI